MDEWDVLNEPIGSETTWTRVNMAEAFPGVPTPLTWTWAGPASDAGVSRAWVNMGVFPRSEIHPGADVSQRFAAISCGRAVLNLDRLRSIGDRIPFNSGNKIERTLFSSDEVSDDSRPVWRRYPFVVTMLPPAVVRARRSLLATAPATEAWWAASVCRVQNDRSSAQSLLIESAQRYGDLIMNQAQTTVASQGLFDALAAVCARYDLPHAVGTLATTTEQTAEVRTVDDLWRFARGTLTLEAFLARHGFHAPVQGELAVPSWRVDPSPVRNLAETYAKRADDDDPASLQHERRRARDAVEKEVLGRAPRTIVPALRLLLAAVRAYVPLREVGRLQFLQCYDVARAAAACLGEKLVDRGVLASSDDVFYLSLSEAMSDGQPPTGLVARRRERRAYYEAHEIPIRFTGFPHLRPITAGTPAGRLNGIGASAGVAQGRARVIEAPDDPNGLEEGEVLVAETTNPSYASFFLVAAAVVVEIGGPLSHGAIVAREMGIPCVINARHALRTIRTGDLLRVDGDRGIVEVLERADGKGLESS